MSRIYMQRTHDILVKAGNATDQEVATFLAQSGSFRSKAEHRLIYDLYQRATDQQRSLTVSDAATASLRQASIQGPDRLSKRFAMSGTQGWSAVCSFWKTTTLGWYEQGVHPIIGLTVALAGTVPAFAIGATAGLLKD